MHVRPTLAAVVTLVAAILDGENAWEFYPYNGYYFFDDLYGLLAGHPDIRTTTYAELLSRPQAPLPPGVPGHSSTRQC